MLFDSSMGPIAAIALSRIDRKRGQYNQAFQLLTRSINSVPQRISSWDELGRIYDDVGKKDEVVECWKVKAVLGDDSAKTDLAKWGVTDSTIDSTKFPWLTVSLSSLKPAFVKVDKNPVPLFAPVPVYPDIAVRARLQGTVWVKILVDKNGNAKKAIIQRSDQEIFNDSAINAALRYKFTPAYIDGKPVAVWATIPFYYRINH